MVAKSQARQLAHPSGLFGRLILAPLWKRRNAALNDAAFERLADRHRAFWCVTAAPRPPAA